MIRRLGGCLSLAAGIAAILFARSVRTASDAVADAPREAVRVSEELFKQSRGGVIAAFEGTSSLDGTAVVVVHEAALRDASLRHGKVVLGRLPLGGGQVVTLEVEPLRVVGPQTKIVVGRPGGIDVPVPYDTSQVHVFRGTVQGRPDSSVVLFWSPRGLRGHIDLGPTDQRYKLSSVDAAGRTLGPGLAVVRPVDRSAEPLPDVPLCGTEGTSVVAGCCPEPPSSVVLTKRLKAVEIAVETDFDLYENFNDLTAETDYIVELFARTNAIFMRDINVRFDVVFIRLFDNPTAEPAFMNDADPLDGYVNFWNTNMGSVARDTGIFLSGRRNLPYGGIAYLGAVCTSFGYCVCGYLSGFPDPTRPNAGDYDTGVVAHELGHNFDACHTPDYCPFIDRCYPPPVFPQRGTLMSYCSQTVSGGNLMTDLWYHTRLRRVMRNFIENGASCVSYDCNQNGVDDGVDISGGASADANGNGVPDECEDCNGNGVLDPTDIALGTSLDVNANGIPDECEPDCNGNGVPDDRDIALGFSADVWGNGVPDECDPDCNGNRVADYNEIQADLSKDLDRNIVLDSCQDCDGNGINDLVQLMGARNAWVASDVLDYVGEYHAVSGARILTSTIGQVNTAQDLIVAPGDRVLVSSAGNNKVIAYNAVTGAYLSDFVPAGSGGLSYPTGLVISPNGNLLVCGRDTNSVLQYDGATGAFLGAFVTTGSGGLTAPFGLTFGPNSDLFVNSGGNQVLEYDGTTGAFLRVFVSTVNNGGLSAARGMLFKPDGNLLVASYNTDALLQYDGPTGAFLGKWNSGGTTSALYLDGPSGLRLGPTGNVFATRDLPASEEGNDHADNDDHEIGELHVTSARIMEFDIRNGKYIRSFVVGDDTGLRSPTGFDFMPGTSDCNFNMLPDNCDLASGTSLDVNGNGVPDECDPPVIVWDADPLSADRTTRSLRFRAAAAAIATAAAAPGENAIRVELVELGHPNPRNAVATVALPFQTVPQNFSTFDTNSNGVCSGAAQSPNHNGHPCDPSKVPSNADCLCNTPSCPSNDAAHNGVCIGNPAPPLVACTATNETVPPDVSGQGGCARWVGRPATFLEAAQEQPTWGKYRAAKLQCTPFYYDWVTETAGNVCAASTLGPWNSGAKCGDVGDPPCLAGATCIPKKITVVGAEILPSSTYSVRTYGSSCAGSEGSCLDLGAPVLMYTRRHGDVASVFTPPDVGQPGAIDLGQILRLLDKGGPLRNAGAKITPNVPEQNIDVDIGDLGRVVAAVLGYAYPPSESGPCPCPPVHPVTGLPLFCGATPCGCDAASGPCAACGGGQCVKTCLGGENNGLACRDSIASHGHCPGGTCGSGFCRDKCARCTP